jgi:hypothetical protein
MKKAFIIAGISEAQETELKAAMNKMNYQGKRKDQIESSYKIFFYMLVLGVLCGIVAGFCHLVKIGIDWIR